jgi:hypothetical protein
LKYPIQGELSGEIKWVNFGTASSNYDAAGTKIDRNAAIVDIPAQIQPKRTIDGVLKILPKEFTHDVLIPEDGKFAVEFKNMKKDQITELGTLTSTIMDNRDPNDLKKLSWIENVSFNIED